MTRIQSTFAALIVTQAAHSVEEYLGRLYDVFPPATFVSGLISSNLQRGFLIGNIALVSWGIWCVLYSSRRQWPSATAFMSIWIVIEIINGIGHPLWSVRQGGYTPGVATAPILLALALRLAWLLRSEATVGPQRNLAGQSHR